MSIIRKSLFSAFTVGAAFLVASNTIAAEAHGADPMDAYYANTWEFKAVDEHKFLQINDDMSFAMKFGDGQVFGGTWSRADKEVCFHVGEEKACFDDLLNRKSGESWTGTHDDHPYTGNLHKGREAFSPPAKPE